MKIKGLDGKTYPMHLVGYQPMESDGRPRSDLHLEVREILRELFPCIKILEEVPLPGSYGLFADFFLPQIKLIVEAHGRQHYEYVYHFHQDEAGFAKAKKRDKNKIAWCEINGISFVACSYKESKDEWKKHISSFGTV
jgi:hypothetical protein